MMDFSFHPLAEIFPLIVGAEFEALVEDIRANGLRESITLFDGRILDGRNRFRACCQADIKPRFEAYEGNDPVGYVVSLNLRRRHLDESQRGMVAAKLANLRDGERADYRSANLPTLFQSETHVTPVSQSQAASLLNVSERTVRAAVKVKDAGVPELVDAVERGTVSVSAAANAE